MAKHLRVTDHPERSAPNAPKMTLNTTRLKIHHMRYIPESRFSIRQAVFMLQAILNMRTE